MSTTVPAPHGAARLSVVSLDERRAERNARLTPEEWDLLASEGIGSFLEDFLARHPAPAGETMVKELETSRDCFLEVAGRKRRRLPQ